MFIASIALLPTRASFAQSGVHGDGHAQHHDWYKELKTRSGWSCCNADAPGAPGDCRPVKARQTSDGRWEAFFNGKWQDVPSDAILPDEQNKVPIYAHICARNDFVFCFLKGGPGA
jgi:hypothetical protein